MKYLATLFLVASTWSCQNSSPAEFITCPDIGRPALAIVLMDTRTSALSPFTEITVVARDGAFKDSVHLSSITDDNVREGRSAIGLALMRPGTFDITVSALGYETWHASNFTTVNNFKCGAFVDSIVARLRPL